MAHKYYSTIDANWIVLYKDRPTIGSAWVPLIQAKTTDQGPITYSTYRLTNWHDITTGRFGYLLVANNEENTSFDIYCIATTGTSVGEPRLFTSVTRSFKGADYGGMSSKIGYFGVWRLGSYNSSNRKTAFELNKIYVMFGASTKEPYGVTDDGELSDAGYNAFKDSPDSWDILPVTNPGSVEITTGVENDVLVTLGHDPITITASSSCVDRAVNVKFTATTTLGNVPLSAPFQGTLPHTLEAYFNNYELRKDCAINLDCAVTTTGSDQATPIVFINNKIQTSLNQTYRYTSPSFTVGIDQTRVPSITSATGTKQSKHKSQYVLLPNNDDRISVTCEISDQSYPYSNNTSNYESTVTLYCGDVICSNYKGTYVSGTGGALKLRCDATWGPFIVNPPVALGVNQYFSVKYADRFGRQAEKSISDFGPYRFYNYIKPSWSITGMRVDGEGVPDDRTGTNAKIDYSWALSLLDYALTPHTGTAQPTLSVTNNQDEQTHTYTITTDTGSNSFTLKNIAIDKSYTFYALLTDACGNAYELHCFVPSGEVFMDFMAGGSGLGIGKRAEVVNQLSVGWDTEMDNDLRVNGTISGPTITDIYNKIAAGGGGGSSGGGGEPVTGSATTKIQKITEPVTYNANPLQWRGIAIPFNYISDSGGEAFLILSASNCEVNTSSSPVTISLPYTFVIDSSGGGGTRVVALVNNHAHGGSGDSKSVWVEVNSNGRQITLHPLGAGDKAFDIIVMGVVEDYFTKNPMSAVTELTLSGGGGSGGGVTIEQVNSAISAALGDYPKTSTVTKMIQNATETFVNQATVQSMINNISASKVNYSSVLSGLEASNTQTAIDNLAAKVKNVPTMDDVTKAISTEIGKIPSNQEAIDKANEAIETASGAVTVAGNAYSAAESAETKAGNAETIANEAKETADSASEVANGIDGKATKAMEDAASALTAANEAKTTAEGIDGKATQAQTDAASAKKTAEEAKEIAEQAAGEVLPSAAQVSFEDTISLGATNVQAAIVALNGKLGLNQTQVQSLITSSLTDYRTVTQIQSMIDSKFNAIVNGNTKRW